MPEKKTSHWTEFNMINQSGEPVAPNSSSRFIAVGEPCDGKVVLYQANLAGLVALNQQMQERKTSEEPLEPEALEDFRLLEQKLAGVNPSIGIEEAKEIIATGFKCSISTKPGVLCDDPNCSYGVCNYHHNGNNPAFCNCDVTHV